MTRTVSAFRTLTAVVVLSLAWLPRTARGQTAHAATDCFALSYGSWTNVDPRWRDPVVPTTTRLEGFSRGAGAGVLRGFARDTAWARIAKAHQPRFTSWRTFGSGSILAVFGSGTGRLELLFSERDSSWTGTALVIGDVVGEPRPRASIVVSPSDCP